jgi:hypothetical protein
MRKQVKAIAFLSLVSVSPNVVFAQAPQGPADKPKVTMFDQQNRLGESIDDFMRFSGTRMCTTAALQPAECEKLSQAEAGQDTVVKQSLPKAVGYWHFAERKLVEVTTLTFDPFWEQQLSASRRTYGPPDKQTSTYAAWFFDDGGGVTLTRDRKRNNFITVCYFSKEKSPQQKGKDSKNK